MFRFIHSSDLHIGKRYGNMPEDLRGRLREARHTVIDRLADHARSHGTEAILLAGDTFDTETPSLPILRQALAAMGAHEALRWVILPGNHDSLLAEELWNIARSAKPDNVELALEAAPIWLTPHVAILPAPCTTRRPGRDLTEWMTDCDTGDAIRIGLAHGAIQSFSEDSNSGDIIAPDRAQKAGLDYLALGDWHGALRVNERTWYSGSPEPDRFKHNKPGRALVVSIAGHGDVPEISEIETGTFEWCTIELNLLSGEDAVEVLTNQLPLGSRRRHILMQVAAAGRVRLSGRSALSQAMEAVAPEFAYADLLMEDLATDCETGDLDRIDQAGALREAAESLLANSLDETRSLEDRHIAREALVRLFSYSEEIQS
jgi:DNA repair exonuclease SbcCD nuclease subunit